MPNSLTRTTGLTLGPIALDTLLKHYFDRVKKEKAGNDGRPFTKLRQDELLYDEAFNISKKFLDVATHHSVEELQEFANSRTPSPPWVHVERVTIPMSWCNEAATSLIQALGGEEHTSHLVGGTKWWQVRGINGISGEWVTAKKDWEEAKRRRKENQKKKTGSNSSRHAGNTLSSSILDSSDICDDADDFCSILYAHEGGYYFGSVDQERHCIQRLARKIKGRVFAVNYRLAPQYPFPCALQDLVAAYLYMIRPPPGASHQPVNPSHIVVAGDSAGGGLTLALLQVLRDTNLPLPAGGLLISPWCDLTHSFPSIHTNTTTDVLPLYGLSIHKPSALWPPPSEEMTHKIHTGLRRKIRQIIRATVTGNKVDETTDLKLTQDALAGSKLNLSGDEKPSNDMPIDVGTTASMPSVDEEDSQTITLATKSGEQLMIDSQIQLYTQNSLLTHPLVSPSLSYLGGLPPLFFIASDKEVLRDEIIYSAHKAANPLKFPPKDDVRALYPPLTGIEERYGPTKVHLQVYDDTAHIVPILFPFTTPGKYCYRAIATFTKLVTGTLHPSKVTPSSSEAIASFPLSSPVNEDINTQQITPQFTNGVVCDSPPDGSSPNSPVPTSDSSMRPSPSLSTFFFQTKKGPAPMPRSFSDLSLRLRKNTQDVQNPGSPSILRHSTSMPDTSTEERYAGEASVYYDEEGFLSWKDGMIRERVSTQGVIRSLEPTDELDAFHVPPAMIGVISERAMRRYLEGKALFERKYAKEMLMVEKERKRNIDLAKKDFTKNLTYLEELQNGREQGRQEETSQSFRDGLESGAWGWAWADERPPPSSIVSRRDTNESRRLARIADRSVFQEGVHTKGNDLWTALVKSISNSPSKEHPVSDSEAAEPPGKERVTIKKSRSVFASLYIREKEPTTQS